MLSEFGGTKSIIVPKSLVATPESRTVHGLEHTYDVLRENELDEWGNIVYAPNRILCAIPTTWEYSLYRIERIQRTWGPLCDILVWAVASEFPVPKDITVGEILVVNMTRSAKPEDRGIWEKTHLMWQAIAKKYQYHAEWFVKVDDDTFVFVEHMRQFTRWYNPSIPRFFGHTVYFRWKINNIVFNAGSCYIMSRESLSRLAVILGRMPVWKGGHRDLCVDRDQAGEDTNMAICLRDLGISPDNTLTQEGGIRFLPMTDRVLYGLDRAKKNDSWYWQYKPEITGNKKECCAPRNEIIAIHGYKGEAKDDEKWNELQEYASTSTGSDRVPPEPSAFLYDKDLLDFEVDEYRNSLPYKDKFPAFTGYAALDETLKISKST